ncbi:MAG: hypothetical protein RR100_10500, partial [Comamonas sp.]
MPVSMWQRIFETDEERLHRVWLIAARAYACFFILNSVARSRHAQAAVTTARKDALQAGRAWRAAA